MNGLNGNNKPNGMHIGVKSSPVHVFVTTTQTDCYTTTRNFLQSQRVKIWKSRVEFNPRNDGSQVRMEDRGY